MLFRKKRINTVEKRTTDTVPFEIVQIRSEEEKRAYQKNKFISPIFGQNTKDEIVIPSPHKREGDLDKQFDNFRTKPKLSKEDRKKKYGSEYPEFDLVKGANLKEVLNNQEKRNIQEKFDFYSDKQPDKKEVIEEPSFSHQENRKEYTNDEVKTSISDFFEEKETNVIKEQGFNNEGNSGIKEKQFSKKRAVNLSYNLPPLSLLQKSEKQINDGHEWIQKQIDVLNKTFEEFQVGAHVYTHTKGPTVTRYEILLDSGVNVKKLLISLTI